MALSRKELTELVRKIMNVEGTEEQIDKMIDILEANVPHPYVSDLIFYPDEDREQTAEEIIEKALSYKPVQL